MITIIVAVAEDGAIGKDQKLLWRLSSDLKRFKALTVGNVVVMGRKTFESLPNGALPNRRNIVLSRSAITFPGAEPIASIEEIKRLGEEANLFIIGGGELYSQTLGWADRICLTLVHHRFPDADTLFPAIDPTLWDETFREEHQADEKHEYPYAFVEYQRRNPKL